MLSPLLDLAVSPAPVAEKLTLSRLFSNEDVAELFAAAAPPASLAALCGASHALQETFAEKRLWVSQLVARFQVAPDDAINFVDPRREFARRTVAASVEDQRRASSSPPRQLPVPPAVTATPPLPRWAERLAESGTPVTRSWSPEDSPPDGDENRPPRRRPLRRLGQRTGERDTCASDAYASSAASRALTTANKQSRACVIARLRASMRQIVMGECGDSVTACPEQPDDWSAWTATVTCPRRDGSLVAGMTFQMHLTYPMDGDGVANAADGAAEAAEFTHDGALPRVQIATPHRLFHPNVNPLTGIVDVRALGTRCSPVALVGEQLLAVLSLLTRPCFSVPALNREAAVGWYGDRAKLVSRMRGAIALAYERAEAEQRPPTKGHPTPRTTSVRRIVSLGL